MSDEYAGRNYIDGRFVKGYKGGPGNPLTKRQYEYRKAWLDAGSVDESLQVRAKLVECALAGDMVAIKMYLELMGGKAALPIELTGPDGDSVKVETANTIGVILAALSKFPEARYAVAAALRGPGQSDPLPIAPSSEVPTDGHAD